MAEEKKERKKHSEKLYKIEGDKVIRVNKTCPKCGPGVFLARHKNRLTCGKCGYTEFLNKEVKKDDKIE